MKKLLAIILTVSLLLACFSASAENGNYIEEILNIGDDGFNWDYDGPVAGTTIIPNTGYRQGRESQSGTEPPANTNAQPSGNGETTNAIKIDKGHNITGNEANGGTGIIINVNPSANNDAVEATPSVPSHTENAAPGNETVGGIIIEGGIVGGSIGGSSSANDGMGGTDDTTKEEPFITVDTHTDADSIPKQEADIKATQAKEPAEKESLAKEPEKTENKNSASPAPLNTKAPVNAEPTKAAIETKAPEITPIAPKATASLKPEKTKAASNDSKNTPAPASTKMPWLCSHPQYSRQSGCKEIAIGYTNITGTTHTKEFKLVKVNYCLSCNNNVTAEEVVSASSSRAENHMYNEDGMCPCGYVCQHEHTSLTKLNQKSLTQISFTPVDDYTHLKAGRAYNDARCNDCGAVISARLPVYVNFSTEEGHSYNNTDTCTVCGYKCTHSSLSCSEYINGQADSCVAYSDMYHRQSGTKITEKTCMICGQYKETQAQEESFVLVKHSFIEGKCIDCGYEEPVLAPCAHENQWEPAGSGICGLLTYETIDTNRHMVSGTAYQIWQCSCCGVKESRLTEEPVSQAEEHTINSNGVCALCGYVRPMCEHTNTYDEYTSVLNGSGAEYVNEKQHRVPSYTVINTYCYDCGTLVSYKRLENSESFLLENHKTDAGGACLSCKCPVKCLHQNVVSSFDKIYNLTCTPVDSRVHNENGTRVLSFTCADCGMCLKTQAEGSNNDWTEAHAFVNGVCVECGYENTCAHANTKVTTDTVTVGHLTDGVNDYARGFDITVMSCADCDVELNRQRVSNEINIKTESHKYAGGRCINCGKGNPCAHGKDYTIVHSMLGGYCEATDENYHKTTGYNNTYLHCNVCGENLNYTAAGQITNRSLSHSFKDGFCVACGYLDKTDGATPLSAMPKSASEDTAQPEEIYVYPGDSMYIKDSLPDFS